MSLSVCRVFFPALLVAGLHGGIIIVIPRFPITIITHLQEPNTKTDEQALVTTCALPSTTAYYHRPVPQLAQRH
jgi:hypothetical protein